MKKIILHFIWNLFALTAYTQNSRLPVKEWAGSSQTPFVFYISGDGGLNNFSNDFCTKVNKKGYRITALNAKSYFWDKKTPEQAAKDLTIYLEKQFENKMNHQWVLIGYSFGADVTPFIINQLPDPIKKNLVSVVLLSPSTSTDFEVHVIDMFGTSKKRSMNVVEEINKLGSIKIITIFGSDEHAFPLKDIKLKNYGTKILPGGHHFEGNVEEVANTVMKDIR